MRRPLGRIYLCVVAATTAAVECYQKAVGWAEGGPDHAGAARDRQAGLDEHSLKQVEREEDIACGFVVLETCRFGNDCCGDGSDLDVGLARQNELPDEHQMSLATFGGNTMGIPSYLSMHPGC